MTKKDTGTGRFSDLGIGKELLSVLTKNKFEIPTPIQHQVIPGALQGKDVVGIAQTGTGKTFAFGIPMIQKILTSHGQGLILVPTRELALQVDEALRKIGTPLGLRCAVVIGGTSQHSQVKALRRNPHIVVATPGRLADLMNQGVYKLNKLTAITLDEADRMLDVGFLPEIKKILNAAPKERQTMLFSATMPKTISSLARAFMKLPMQIEIAPQGTSAENIEQEIFVVTRETKMRLLDSLLEQHSSDKVLIFSRTKHGAKKLAHTIRGMGHTATEIHSNRSQAQRKAALEGFTRGRYRIMVATDIASRGIDVKDISLVINFDLPDNTEDYVHRIGRTGRAGKHGKAVSFVTSIQKLDVMRIERLIRQQLPIAPMPDLPPARPKTPHEEPRQHKPRRYSSYRGGGNSSGRGGGPSRGRQQSPRGQRRSSSRSRTQR